MKIQLLRHASCLITFNNQKILLDPMFKPDGTFTALPGVLNPSMNPIVDLPENVKLDKLTPSLNAVLVSHTHRDHFDNTAIEMLVHMEAWNHCRLSRKELHTFLKQNSLTSQVYVPENGDCLAFE